MSEVHYQSERKSLVPYLVVPVILLTILYLLAKGCTNSGTDHVTTESNGYAAKADNTSGTDKNGWANIDFNSPAAAFEELDSNINVKGSGNYAIYSLGENILFDEDKATIRPDAEQNLKQVTGSIEKRFEDGSVRVYGHTDAEGTAGYNKDLATQRAEAVKNWLIKNGIPGSNISTEPVGESKPVATNATENGRQQNRRVEIVAKAKGE